MLIPEISNMFSTYRLALEKIENGLDERFQKAVSAIAETRQHVIICGMGKSGLVGRKIAATFSSTGTAAIFLHPAEAIHGDLGMVRENSVVILISNSGETEEVVKLLPALKRLNVKIIALLGAVESTIANISDIILDVSIDREACPLNLAPTTSTLTTLVMGDALAIALMEQSGFKPEDFAANHPGGRLGQRLLSRVKDRMVHAKLPLVYANMPMSEVIVIMTEARLGLALVQKDKKLEGIITDGDLRRMLVTGTDLSSTIAGDVMNNSPLTIAEDEMMTAAEEKMLEARVQSLVVISAEGLIDGVVQIY
ncbi:KpsF/GutQ family sugar-phosphate isomerase [Alphaproteobacteria bacterium]|nr:KpsF/GutQ family sugar-phosphate isomerase [Alphaproteobacteria bacterium]MBT5798533.1 KpsF/GutQ family sugar-phosphate isomerase [Alphaproteobacteria bacterium]MDC0394940.1 KpsF/GutQ family sugar-phosphate isomerase [Alphaproteobacteria bacterium]